jgi:hypothetical protein
MKKRLENKPYFIILIGVFYLLSLANQYYPILKVSDLTLPVSLLLIAINVFLYIIFTFIFPKLLKYALLLLYLQMVYFFYGSLQDFLKDNINLLSRYRYLMPLLLGFGVIIWIALKRSSASFAKHFRYLNTLFIILVVTEVARSITITATDGQSKLWFSQRKDPRINTAICDTCFKPDIYFVIFDGYTASRTLKEYWNYDNNGLDSFFRQNGFYYAWHSRSNYNSTPYSIGSILNMGYHAKRPNRKIDVVQFCKGIESVQTNSVCKILEKNNYKIINQSCFPLPNQKAPLTITYLTRKERILLAQTLWSRAMVDIGWNFPLLNRSSGHVAAQIARAKSNRLQVTRAYDSLLKISAQHYQQPVFVYAHFFVPHDPYFYDSTGKITPDSTWIHSRNAKERYLSQLKYTNTIIKDVVTHLKKEGNRPRVLIIQSDHGFRTYGNVALRPLEFNNLNAIYFPDQDYAQLYDSITSVNTFPVVFRKYLHAPIPLLKDSTIFLIK